VKIKRSVVALLAIIIVLPVACTLTLVFFHNPRDFADFTRFASESAVQSFLNRELPTSIASIGDLSSFLRRENVWDDCWATKPQPYDDLLFEADSVFRCRTLAPSDFSEGAGFIEHLIVSIILPREYVIDFYLNNGILVNFSVRKSS
jgi:hypothetical protein